MMKRIIVFALLSLTLTLFMPVHAQDEAFCHQAAYTYTNATAGEQTLYVTVYEPVFKKVIGPSTPFAKLASGATFEGLVQEPAVPDKGYVFGISTAKVDPAAPVFLLLLPIEPCNVFNDNRLNPDYAAAPVIVYKIETTAFDFYGVDTNTGNGQRILRLLIDDIRPVVERAKSQGQNLLIEEVNGVSIYALSSGTCQMNVFEPTGKLYEFEWYCDLADE